MDGTINLASLDSAWVATVFLVSLRLGATFLMTPVLSAAVVPLRIRLLLILGLGAALSIGFQPLANSTSAFLLQHPGRLVEACCSEVALGATLGTGILVAFSSFTVAGRLLDIQVGFGFGQALDPISNTSIPMITTAFNQLALVVFFLLNGHHALMRGFAFSLERFPLGQPWPMATAAGPILKQAAGLFGLAFALAAPVVFSLLLVEMALGVLARNMPQINMLVMGIPLKIIVGLLTLSIWSSGMGAGMARIYGTIYKTWDSIFSTEFKVDQPQGSH